MEMIYHYLWKQRMMGRRLATVDGRKITILNPGRHNNDAGPDFLGARIVIDGQEWAGNVEIHTKASDWHRHGHDTDPAYDNVVLHVVAVDDARIPAPGGGEIPQTVVTLPESFFKMFAALSANIAAINCQPWVGRIPALHRTDWLSTLSVERLQEKAARIQRIADSMLGDWNQACFAALARALGFNLNGDPFEMLARSLPLRILHHHSDNHFQLEALLFGQAGMLDTSQHIFDEYYQMLSREYFFLARKYGLRPLNAGIWKYARTRPQNFPHRRIALLACALDDGFPLLSSMRENRRNPEAIRTLFNWRPKGYWETHIDFDVDGLGSGRLSGQALDLLTINFTAPMLYADAIASGNPEATEDALGIWMSIAPENNTYIRQWRAAGIEPRDAADTQALLQLRTKYCDADRCLDCRFAATLLKNSSDIPVNAF